MMKPMVYLANSDNLVARFFRENIREADILREHGNYETQYVAAAPFQKLMFPFKFVERGDRVIQVGAAEWMIEFGVSMPLILSALVGAEGQVLAVEPDQRNIRRFDAYLRGNSVGNVRFFEGAAGRTTHRGEIVLYEDRSSSNVLKSVLENIDEDEYSDPNRRTHVQETTIATIDEICEARDFHPNFVCLTINGGEFDAIRGMESVINQGTIVTWIISGLRDWWKDSFEWMSERGYEIIVGDFPYTHRAPNIDQGGVRFHSSKEVAQYIFALAMPREKVLAVDNLDLVRVEKIDGRFEFHPA